MRLPEAEEAGIYRAAAQFVDQTLRTEGSLFTPGRAIWTVAGIDDFHKRFVLRPNVTGASFEARLKQQLKGAPADTIQLVAEMLYVYFLLPKDSGGDTKRTQLATVLSWSASPVALPSSLADALDHGIVKTGFAYFTLRYDQLCYFVNLVRSWRQLEGQEVESSLRDPWEFKAFAGSIDAGPAKAMREALNYLVFPDSFEPIVSLDHKKEFAEFFADLAPGIDDLDQRLLAIHRSIAATHGAFATFYDPMIEQLMDGPERRVWWVNQGATYAEERAGGYLWAPRKNKAGNTEHGWTNVSLVKAGDIVVHYADAAIQALSIARTAAADADKPVALAGRSGGKDGWQVSVEMTDLSTAVSLSELPQTLRTPGSGPFAETGRVKPGYLWDVPSEMAAALAAYFGTQWPDGHALVSKAPTVTTTGGTTVSLHPIYASIADKGFSFPDWLVTDYLLSLGSKPFVLLSGISGTGKTKLAQLVADYLAPREQVLEAEGGEPDVDADSFVHRVGTSTLKYGTTVPRKNGDLFPDYDPAKSYPCRVEGQGLSGTGRFYPEGFYQLGLMQNASVSWHRSVLEWLNASSEIGDFLIITPRSSDGLVLSLRVVKARRKRVEAQSSLTAFISVRSDWTDNRSMLGYYNPLTEQYVPTELLRLLLHAVAHPERPHFAILDEMNLAKVEYYFSDFLSAMESGTDLALHDAGEAVTAEIRGEELPIPERVKVPANLLFTGTVNVDETTFMFSPKVLDRANVIQFHAVDLSSYRRDGTLAASGDDSFTLPAAVRLDELLQTAPARRSDYVRLGAASYGCLETVNEILEVHHLHFGYRVANEIARYLGLVEKYLGSNAVPRALDLQIQQKILPKFVGNRAKLERPLWELLVYLQTGNREVVPLTALALDALAPSEAKYPESVAALQHMLQTLRQVGFASFIE